MLKEFLIKYLINSASIVQFERMQSSNVEDVKRATSSEKPKELVKRVKNACKSFTKMLDSVLKEVQDMYKDSHGSKTLLEQERLLIFRVQLVCVHIPVTL